MDHGCLECHYTLFVCFVQEAFNTQLAFTARAYFGEFHEHSLHMMSYESLLGASQPDFRG